ncbi:hypothetical protein OAL88_00670 [bacterium]|nr:hypothetical protein [bacterium]
MRYQNFLNASSYPLWSHFEDADCKGDFSFELTDQVENETGTKLIFKPTIASTFLRENIEKRKIRLIMSLSCQATYEYSEMQLGMEEEQEIQLENKNLFGNVYLTMLAFSCASDLKYPADELDGIYRDSDLFAEEGAILAISNELQVNLEPQPQPLDVSFFELELANDIDPELYEVDTSGDSRVVIKAGREVYEKIDYNRSLGEPGEKMNLASIYFPILLSTLYILKEDSGQHAEKAWLNGLIAAYPNLEANLQSKDFEPLEIAQQIFKSPFVQASKALDWE